MKRKMTGIIVIVAIALLAGWNIIQQKEITQQEGNMDISELALANINALAGCEVEGWIPGDFWVTLYGGCNWSCRRGGPVSCPV